MKPAPFAYHRPESVDHALDLLAELGDEAKVLSGGQSLVPMMNLRLARPEVLIDINDVDLAGVEVDGDVLRLGALVRHQTLERDPVVARSAPLVALAAPLIGHPPIRVRGTLGGSIAHADAAAELPTVMVALDAKVVVRSATRQRSIPIEEFFVGTFMTALEDDELIVGIDVPAHGSHLCAYEELTVRAGDFALVGSAVAVQFAADDTVTDARIALSGASSKPVRVKAAEEALLGTLLEPAAVSAAGAAAAAATTTRGDMHGSQGYRRHLADVLTRRALGRVNVQHRPELGDS